LTDQLDLELWAPGSTCLRAYDDLAGGSATASPWGRGWRFQGWGDKIGFAGRVHLNRAHIPTRDVDEVGDRMAMFTGWFIGSEPIVLLHTSGHRGGYVLGGGGFYVSSPSCTEPVFIGYYAIISRAVYPQYSNVTLSHFSSNQGGRGDMATASP